jgi:hypothetical protein
MGEHASDKIRATLCITVQVYYHQPGSEARSLVITGKPSEHVAFATLAVHDPTGQSDVFEQATNNHFIRDTLNEHIDGRDD